MSGGLDLPAAIYDADPDWWERQVALAACALTVDRGPGRGSSSTYPDGGFDHVCTRKDLSGDWT